MTQAAVPQAFPHGLRASPPETLSFAPDTEIRAYLLERELGNLVVYSTTGLDPEGSWAAETGGVERHYLNHHHEAMFPARRSTVPVFVHADDRAAVEPAMPVRAAFSRRHVLDADFEVIPIPGHTPGATAYLWDAGEHRFLFTGDSLYLDDGEWVGAVLDSSDRAAYLESLDLLRGLNFDVLVPWAASKGQPPVAYTGPVATRRRIGRIIDRVRKGADR